MATYKKKLLNITVTLMDGSTKTLADTANNMIATSAFTSFKSGNGAFVDANTFVPITAVVQVVINSVTETDVEKATDC